MSYLFISGEVSEENKPHLFIYDIYVSSSASAAAQICFFPLVPDLHPRGEFLKPDENLKSLRFPSFFTGRKKPKC